MATPNIDSVNDIICCPGHDFCNLANAQSIPIAKQVSEHFTETEELNDIGKLHLNISGCINACGHHHTGHIGVLGIDKRGEDFYQIMIGGHAGTDETLPASIGTILGPAVPPEKVVPVVEELLRIYRSERVTEESFIETVNRVGIAPFKGAVNV